MRTSAIVSISLPQNLFRDSEKVAKRYNMTRSEFIRSALRTRLDEEDAMTAVHEYQKEKVNGKLRVLKGSVSSLLE